MSSNQQEEKRSSSFWGEDTVSIKGNKCQKTVLESPKGAAEGHILRDARVRLCDLQSALGDRVGARACWEKGIKRWPKDGLMYNELGSLAIQGPERDVPLAREYFESAFHFGYALSELNIAICMEFLGETAGARARYAAVAQKLAARNPENPTGHIRIKAATLLPPLVPPDPAGGGLGARRALQDVEHNLDDLLTAPWDHHDNTEPLRHAFPTGMGFLWYGAEGGDAEVKRKLGAVYTLLCPALLTGRFFDADDLAPTGNQIIYDMDVRYIGADPENNGFDGKQFKLMPPETHLFHKPKNKTVEEDDVLVPEPRRPGPLRVGVVTRFLAGAHPNGLLALGLLRELARLEKYELYAFLIQTFPEDRHDPRWQQALKYVHEGVIVPESLKVALQRVKDRYPDVLVYPEVGPDPVQYFMSFCRAAPVQAAWWGHPDTTGSPNIDWFVTSSIELPGVEKRYSEKPWLMEGLGAYFIRPELLHDLDPDYYRNLFVRQLNLPPNFHFYYVAAPIERMHPLFVEAIAEILEKDKLGFALVPNSRFEPQWFQEFERRYGRPRAARLLFFGTSGEQEDLALMESSEVVLEPFPSAHFYPALQALSLGVPLVAKVGATLAGRTTLAMYRKLGVGDLLAATAQEYVQTALKVALAPNYRAQLSSRILAANYKLFEDTSAVHEWEKFLTMVGAPLLSGEQPILIRRTHLTPAEEAAARERAGKPRAGLWRGNKPGEAPEDLLAAQQQQRRQQEAEEERERRGGARPAGGGLPEAEEGAAVVGGGGGAAEASGAADAGSPGGGRNDAPDAVAVVVGEEEEGQGGGGTVDHHTTTYMRVTPTKPSHQKQGQEWSPPPASDDAATAIKRDGPTTAGSREEEDAMTKKVRISTSPTEGKQHGHQSHNHQLHHKHHTSAEGEEHAPALDYLGTDEIKFEKRHNSKARRRKKREHISDDTTEGRGGGENEEANFVKHQQQQHQDEL